MKSLDLMFVVSFFLNFYRFLEVVYSFIGFTYCRVPVVIIEASTVLNWGNSLQFGWKIFILASIVHCAWVHCVPLQCADWCVKRWIQRKMWHCSIQVILLLNNRFQVLVSFFLCQMSESRERKSCSNFRSPNRIVQMLSLLHCARHVTFWIFTEPAVM